MKKIYLITVALSVLVACKPKGDGSLSSDVVNNPMSANSSDKSKLPVMSFKDTTFNFGTIKQNDRIEHKFVFTNKGKSDLVISNAYGSCGCTIPEWPKKPIAPGEEETINVVFNSANKSGSQHKTVTIIANTIPNSTEITITGNVIAPEKK